MCLKYAWDEIRCLTILKLFLISSFVFQVYLDSPVIFNGVSIRWKGYINLEKLDGVGGFRFDDDSARVFQRVFYVSKNKFSS